MGCAIAPRATAVFRVMTVLVAICCVSCISLAPDLTSDILAGVPADTRVEENRINARLVELGPRAIRNICRTLTPRGVGNDSKARYVLGGLAVYASRPDAGPERKMVARTLVKALRSASDKEVKVFLIRQLQRIGREESVAPLAKFLVDEQLCDPAAQALLAIRTSDVERAFLRALPRVGNANRVTVVNALGELRSRAAVDGLLTYATGDDEALRWAALYALANIGDPAAAEVLAETAELTWGYEGAKAASFYLLFARRLAEVGDREGCAAICRDLLKSRSYVLENNIHCAALDTLVTVLGAGALDNLMAAMDVESSKVRAAALELAADMPGEETTARWIDKMEHVRPETRTEILAMLARRGDKSALPALLRALQDENKSVRLAAVPAAARLGGSASLPALLAFLQTERPDEIEAVQEVFMSLPGTDVVPAIAESLPEVSDTAQVALLEVLAARRARQYVETVFALARDDDRSVRVAAIEALEPLADETHLSRLIDLVLDVATDAERSAAQKVAASVARQTTDPDTGAGRVLAVFEKTSDEKKSWLLPVLAGVGGENARQAVVREIDSADPLVQDAAVRALADWPDASAADELLDIARTSAELKQRVLALRGYVRLVGTAGLSEEETFKMYENAMAAAERPDEKKLVLAGLAANVRTVKSLKLAGSCLEDELLRAEAVLAAAAIACPENRRRRGLQGRGVVEVLEKVLVVCEDDEVRERVERYLDTIPKPEEPGPFDEGFVPLFNGRDLDGWTGDTDGYVVEDGKIICRPGGNLYTEKEYSDFALRFEFKLTPGANNGLGIRAPLEGDAAYVGMEIQILDNTADGYKDLKPYQYHGSIYGVVPAGRGYLKPVGEWNFEEVIARGNLITVNLNGTTIVDADIREASTPETMDGRPHPGLKRTTGHIGFLGHGSPVEFRNIRIKELK